MVGVCLITPEQGEAHEVDQWVYLSWAMSLDGVWATDTAYGRSGVTTIKSLSDLPPANLIVVQPLNGANIKGTEPLSTFIHPPNALYIFGASNTIMAERDIAGVSIHSKVYIASISGTELHAPIAGAMVLFDRASKG